MMEVINLTKRIGSRDIVSDVSLSVERGEIVALLGRSGSGKTTVFSMIAGMLSPDSGTVTLNGTDLSRMEMFERARRGLGYLSQQPSLFPGLTVSQNLLLALESRIGDRAKRQAVLERLLRQFSIEHIGRMSAAKLSGGERRRVEIARTLAGQPQYILLDEPFAGIDPITLGEIKTLLRAITRFGIGVLVTDHNVRETLGLVDHAYIIEGGRILIDGTPTAIADNPDVWRSYLGANFSL